MVAEYKLREVKEAILKTVFRKVGVFLSLFSVSVFADTYQVGHEALQLWTAEAQAGAPIELKVWLYSMTLVFALGIFFVKRHVEARLVLLGFIFGLFFSKLIIPMLGIVKLSGLVSLIHIVFWSPGLYLLLTRRPFSKGVSPYAIWSGLMLMLIIISFFFDIRDAGIYIAHIAA